MPELSVMASGCLGLVSFPREPGRVTLEQIEAKWPALLPALREHPGVGFLLVRSERDGAVVLGPQGSASSTSDRVEGEDPLAGFPPNAARHIRRTDGFPHCPDIVVNSTYWAETDEVAAFEELVGSHGGMGGGQSWPFAHGALGVGRADGAGGRRRGDAPSLPGLAGRPGPRGLQARMSTTKIPQTMMFT